MLDDSDVKFYKYIFGGMALLAVAAPIASIWGTRTFEKAADAAFKRNSSILVVGKTKYELRPLPNSPCDYTVYYPGSKNTVKAFALRGFADEDEPKPMVIRKPGCDPHAKPSVR